MHGNILLQLGEIPARFTCNLEPSLHTSYYVSGATAFNLIIINLNYTKFIVFFVGKYHDASANLYLLRYFQMSEASA